MKYEYPIVALLFVILIVVPTISTGYPTFISQTSSTSGNYTPTLPGSRRPPSPQRQSIPEEIRATELYYNWTAFWTRFRQNSAWDLEWYNGVDWISKKSDLTIIRDQTEDTVKLTLNFTASETGNYRLTFAINKKVKRYIHKTNAWNYTITYNTHNLIFDWSDIKNIPNLQTSHGVKDDYFWFRIRKDNISSGAHISLDPTLIAGGVEGEHYYQRHVWYAKGRWWLFYSDSTNAIHNSTTDGSTNWVGAQLYAGVQNTQRIAVYYNGSHFFCVVTLTDLFFRQGEPQADGTISWDAVWQNLGRFGSAYVTECFVTADSEGYPWVSGDRETETIWLVSASDSKNGTWDTRSGFPINMVTDQGPEGCLVPLNNSAVRAIWVTRNDASVAQSRLYNGTGWEAIENVTTTTVHAYAFNALGVNSSTYLTYRDETTGRAYFGSIEWNGVWFPHPYESTSSDAIAYLWGTVGESYGTIRNSTTGDVNDSGIGDGDVGQEFDGSDYGVSRTFLYFDTSTIPDTATVTSATIRLYGYGSVASETNFNIVIQNGQPTYPHDTIVIGDYDKDLYSGNGGQFNATGWSNTSYNEITLNSNGRSWINKTGITKICLRSSKDINNIAPTTDEWVSYYTSEQGVDYTPELVIETEIIKDISGSIIINTPSMMRRQDGEIWILWGDGNKKIWIRYFNGMEWSSKRYIGITEPVYSGGEAVFEVTTVAWPKTGLLFYGSLYFDVFSLFEDWYVAIDDMEGCGNWVFAEEQYYHFRANYTYDGGYELFDTVKVRFYDGETNITVAYDYITGVFGIEAGEEKINLRPGTVTTTELTLEVIFEIYFESKILDTLNADIYMWANFTDNTVIGWELPLANVDYFNIYNLGGFAEYSSSGDANRTTGGDVFEFETQADGVIRANVTYRKLQHFRTLFSWFMNVTHADKGTDIYQNESVMFGLDFCYNDEWFDGLSVRITHAEEVVSADHIYMFFDVTWYYQGYQIGAPDIISAYYEGVFVAGQGEGPKRIRFWVDLWFNKINASTTIGGSVSSYFVGMNDTSNPWLRWLTGTSWGPTYNQGTGSMSFEDLQNITTGEIFSSKEIELMKVWGQLTGDENHTSTSDYFGIGNFEEFDFETASGLMEGIDTPIFTETKVPSLPTSGGLAGPLWAGLQWVGNQIAEMFGPAILGFWNTFVGFLDTIFTAVGWDNGFSTILTWITTFGSFITNATITLIQFLTPIFNILVNSVTPLTSVLSIFGGWIASIFQGITGTISLLNVAIVDSGLGELFTAGLLLMGIMLPIMELVRMEEHGFGILFDDLSKVMNVASFVITITITVVQFFIQIITGIINAIPVVE